MSLRVAARAPTAAGARTMHTSARARVASRRQLVIRNVGTATEANFDTEVLKVRARNA